jgi:hypothetical protein
VIAPFSVGDVGTRPAYEVGSAVLSCYMRGMHESVFPFVDVLIHSINTPSLNYYQIKPKYA